VFELESCAPWDVVSMLDSRHDRAPLDQSAAAKEDCLARTQQSWRSGNHFLKENADFSV